jgi:Lar family restriction alleviation protein
LEVVREETLEWNGLPYVEKLLLRRGDGTPELAGAEGDYLVSIARTPQPQEVKVVYALPAQAGAPEHVVLGRAAVTACPFCGGAELEPLKTPSFGWRVGCEGSDKACYATGPYRRSKASAIAAWNRRAKPEKEEK